MKKILIIDDNRLSREINSSNLEQSGHEVIKANDGAEGIRILKSKKVDLVILDLIMPGLDGFGFLNICKNDPLTRDIPVIVLTGRDSLEEIDRVKKSGAKDCLVKYKTPPAALAQYVKMVLGF